MGAFRGHSVGLLVFLLEQEKWKMGSAFDPY